MNPIPEPGSAGTAQAAQSVLADRSSVLREAADHFARRLQAVERLCSGRPSYDTITVKALLIAMGEAAAPAAGERGTCSACGEPAVRYILGGWSHTLRNGCGDGEPVVAEFVPPAGAVRADDADGEGAGRFVAYRSRTAQMLRCLAHVPPPAARAADWEPVTPEDLPDGGICTYPDCGVDVLITEGN